MIAKRSFHYSANDIHRVKADKKPLRLTKGMAKTREIEKGQIGVRHFLLLCMAFAATSPAFAEMLAHSVQVDVIEVGGHCEVPPDLVIPAPSAGGGKFQRNFGTASYIVPGDRFAAIRELGIGIRVRIEGYEAGRTVTVKVIPPVGDTGIWDLQIGPDGTLDFGRLPAVGEALPEGRYVLAVLDKGRTLFAYVITIEGVDEATSCRPVS